MVEYNLTPFERAFIFQITKQDSRINDYISKIGGTFYSSNGWKVQVSAEPEVNVFSKTIFLRGNKSSSDLRVDRTWNLPSNSFRDKTISDVKDTLTEIISSAEKYYAFAIPGSYAAIDLSSRLYDVAEVIINIASEVMPPMKPKFRIDAEGWGNNKLSPSKNLVRN